MLRSEISDVRRFWKTFWKSVDEIGHGRMWQSHSFTLGLSGKDVTPIVPLFRVRLPSGCLSAQREAIQLSKCHE